MPGIYQIYAWSSAYPQFNAEAELDVLKVELGNLPDVYLEATYPGESEQSKRTVEPTVMPNTQAVRDLLTFESSDTDKATVSYNSTQNKLTISGIAESISQEDITIIAKFNGTDLDTDSISVLEATSVGLISGAGSGNCTDSHPPPERVEWPIVWQVNDQFGDPFACVGLEIYENIRVTDSSWNPIGDWGGWVYLDVTDGNGRLDDLHARWSDGCLDNCSDFYNLQKFGIGGGERELSPIFKEKIETSCSSGTETITE